MEHDVSAAAAALARLTGFDGVEAAFLRDHLAQEVAEAQRFWYRFPVTPYNAYPLHAYRSEIFAVAGFRDGSDVDRYLALLDDYVALVEQLGETMAGSASAASVCQCGRCRRPRLPYAVMPPPHQRWWWHQSGSPGWLLVRRDGWRTAWRAWWRGGWRRPTGGCLKTWRRTRARQAREQASVSTQAARIVTPD